MHCHYTTTLGWQAGHGYGLPVVASCGSWGLAVENCSFQQEAAFADETPLGSVCQTLSDHVRMTHAGSLLTSCLLHAPVLAPLHSQPDSPFPVPPCLPCLKRCLCQIWLLEELLARMLLQGCCLSTLQHWYWKQQALYPWDQALEHRRLQQEPWFDGCWNLLKPGPLHLGRQIDRKHPVVGDAAAAAAEAQTESDVRLQSLPQQRLQPGSLMGLETLQARQATPVGIAGRHAVLATRREMSEGQPAPDPTGPHGQSPPAVLPVQHNR